MSRSARREPRRLIERAAAMMPEGAVMPREMAQALVEKVVRMSKADDVQVNVTSGYQADLRFAANQVSTSGGVVNGQVAVTSTFGKKHATTVTNDLSDDALRATIDKSEALAKLSPDDPEVMPALGPQTYAPVSGYFDSTANLSAEDRARAALTALEPARKAGDLKAAGFIIVNAGSNALGNGKGLFAYNRSTTANYTLTVRTNGFFAESPAAHTSREMIPSASFPSAGKNSLATCPASMARMACGRKSSSFIVRVERIASLV